MRLFLASSIDITAKAISEDIGKKKPRLAFISTAAEPEDPPFDWLENDRNGLKKAGFSLFNYTISDKTIKDFDKDLKDAEIIHLNGGNTYYLLRQSLKSGFDKWIKKAVTKGVIYTGSSAGSIIAGPKCPDYLLTKKEIRASENKNGFGFVDFITLPHWGQNSFFKDMYLKTRLRMAYKENLPPLVLLNDYQYVKVVGDMYKMVDIRD